MAAAPRLGSVEVLRDVASRLWYSGHVIEVLSDAAVVVAFENDVWPRAEFPVSSIRKPPKLSAAELDRFSPHVNEEVELRVAGSEHAPSGWGAALVRKIQHSFYFVSLVSVEETAIVEKDQLRPKTLSHGLQGGILKQELYKLPRELESWICTSDAVQCFEHIEEQSGLIFVQTLRSELRLIGDAKTIQRAKMLLQLHIKHQNKIQSFQETLDKQLTALEKKRNRIEGTGYKHSVEFQVEDASVPRIIGKGGEAIRSLQDKYEVNISVLPQEGEDGRRVVRIFGNHHDNIDKARAEVEYVEEAMPIEPKMKSWILGRGGKTIQSFKESTNLLNAHLDSEGEKLWLRGTRRSVHDAKAMFETHLMYYNAFLQMDEEMEQILNELQEYGDTNARWEWGWYRDQEDEYTKRGYGEDWKPGKNGKGAKNGGNKGGKGGGGKKGKDWKESPAGGWAGRKDKDWEEPPASASGKRGKDWEEAQGSASGGKRKEWEEAPTAGGRKGKEWEESSASGGRKGKEWEESPATRPARGRGGGKGTRSAAGSKSGDLQEDQGKEEDAEGSGAAEENAPKGAGRGASGRTGAAGARNGATQGGRAAAAAASVPEREPRLTPSGRRMGKKGLRS